MPSPEPFTDEERLEAFAEKVDKRDRNSCWEWLAFKQPKGYGKFWNGSCHVRAHRYSWQLFNGPIPEGKMVLHKCNNRGCVNPNHLYVGDGVDNVRDMIESGRSYNLPNVRKQLNL